MSEMQSVNVDLGERSYPIMIGPGLLDRADLLQAHIPSRQVCIVSNETVAPLYLQRLKAALNAYDLSEIILPDGEEHKTLDQVARIYDALLDTRFGRSGTLVALGGGVVGDMTGFAAATYQRGVNFIQVPTTLLSQVDSSVGGKTGVNRPMGKNMVGAFYQPSCVIADTGTLDTLADRELRAGLAEVIKYGLINNREFDLWLRQNLKQLLARDQDSLAHAIKVSCEEKAAIVAKDERESGIRAILNLGHTFGHAIETAMGYGAWLHGEAIAAGMVMAADLSMRLLLISQGEAALVKEIIAAAGLPVCPPPDIGVDRYLELMGRDKKSEAGKIRFVLLEKIGKAIVRGNVDTRLVEQTLIAGAALTESTAG